MDTDCQQLIHRIRSFHQPRILCAADVHFQKKTLDIGDGFTYNTFNN